jgi:hypothetical protein
VPTESSIIETGDYSKGNSAPEEKVPNKQENMVSDWNLITKSSCYYEHSALKLSEPHLFDYCNGLPNLELHRFSQSCA